MVNNEEVIRSVNDLFQNKEFMDSFMKGVSFCEREKYFQDKIDVCQEALSYQDELESQAMNIRQYASLYRFLQKLKTDRQGDKYSHLDERIEEVDKTIQLFNKNVISRFIHADLLESLEKEKQSLLTSQRILKSLGINIKACEEELEEMLQTMSNTKLAPIVLRIRKADPNRPEFALENAILQMFTKEDIDTYCRKMERDLEQYQEQKANATKEKESFLNSTNALVRKIIELDYDTAFSIASFYQNHPDEEIPLEIAFRVFAIIRGVQTSQGYLEQPSTFEISSQNGLEDKAKEYYKTVRD